MTNEQREVMRGSIQVPTKKRPGRPVRRRGHLSQNIILVAREEATPFRAIATLGEKADDLTEGKLGTVASNKRKDDGVIHRVDACGALDPNDSLVRWEPFNFPEEILLKRLGKGTPSPIRQRESET